VTLIDDIGRSKYVNLTTYRKDGTAVATPVWQVMHGAELVVVSDANAWKVKRIRNNSQVVVTVCDFRGRVAPGAPSAKGEARLLDELGTQEARALLAKKYVTSRLGNRLAKLLRLRRPPLIGIVVTFEGTA
jgi:PPOX class probable F420-dependent enzyme